MFFWRLMYFFKVLCGWCGKMIWGFFYWEGLFSLLEGLVGSKSKILGKVGFGYLWFSGFFFIVEC